MAHHILGAGSIGCLVAASLRGTPTLVMRNETKRLHLSQLDNTLRIVGKSELAKKVNAVTAQDVGPIETLIVCTKAQNTVEALSPLVDKLGPSSLVVLLQNGIGVENHLKARFWPEGGPRISHGLTAQGIKSTPVAYTFEHTGLGPFIFKEGSLTPREFEPFADIVELSEQEFYRQRVLKLLVNAAINPLTAILDCPNGLIASEPLRHMVERLVRESCSIASSHYKLNLNWQEVLEIVLKVSNDTSTNTSSMRADVQRGQPTEIDYINGHLIEIAEKQGIKSLRNKFVRDLVLAKGAHEQQEANRALPLRTRSVL